MKNILISCVALFFLLSCNLESEIPQPADFTTDWVGVYDANYKAIVNDGQPVPSNVSIMMVIGRQSSKVISANIVLKIGDNTSPTNLKSIILTSKSQGVINESFQNNGTIKATGTVTLASNQLVLDVKFEYGTNGVQVLHATFTKE